MRRASAILLVFLFSFSLIAPALWVEAPSNLPACCRRGGAHHCSQMSGAMADAQPSGLALDALRIKCPFFPNGGAVVPETAPALPAASQTSGLPIVCQIADQPRTEAGYRSSLPSSHQKRGPPSLLS